MKRNVDRAQHSTTICGVVSDDDDVYEGDVLTPLFKVLQWLLLAFFVNPNFFMFFIGPFTTCCLFSHLPKYIFYFPEWAVLLHVMALHQLFPLAECMYSFTECCNCWLFVFIIRLSFLRVTGAGFYSYCILSIA